MFGPPRRSLVELAHYVCSHGSPMPGQWDPTKPAYWSDEWSTMTADWDRRFAIERVRRAKLGKSFPASTCAITQHGLLHACGCTEPWVMDPARWKPGSPIRLWRMSQERRNPKLGDLLPGDLLVIRASTFAAHIRMFLSTLPDGRILTADGGQPGGRVKEGPLATRDVLHVPLDRLLWREGAAPTVGQWQAQHGLVRRGYAVAEAIVLDPELLARADQASPV